MPTFNTVLNEFKNVPVDELEDLYPIIHSLRTDTKKTNKANQEVLSYAGSFGDMSESDYIDFVNHTKQTRNVFLGCIFVNKTLLAMVERPSPTKQFD